jgi:hypothetical protein
MEGLLWSVGAVLIGVVGVCVYTLLELRRAQGWIYEAREQAPAKKIANMEAFMSTLRKEWTTLTELVDEKHDRWLREQASLRTYVHRRLGKEIKDDESGQRGGSPDRISAEEARQLASGNGAASPVPEDPRAEQRRKIKEAYYAARR